MEQYYINPKNLYIILKEKGITNLYHANSMLTATTFIEQGALLSRGYIEDKGLAQTEQQSDDNDKQVNVWYDIFLDGKDLSVHYNRPNLYGPVLFVMKLEMLLSPNIGNILITKDNPMYWNINTPLSDRYYNSCDNFKKDYLNRGKHLDARIMFTFRNADTLIRLKKFCVRIILDKTMCLYQERNLDETFENHIKNKMQEASIGHIPLETRENYKKQYIAMFKSKFNQFLNLFRINR